MSVARFVDGPAEGLEISFPSWAPPRVHLRRLVTDKPDEVWWTVLTIDEAVRLGAVTYQLAAQPDGHVGYQLAPRPDVRTPWTAQPWQRATQDERSASQATRRRRNLGPWQ